MAGIIGRASMAGITGRARMAGISGRASMASRAAMSFDDDNPSVFTGEAATP